MEIIPHATIRFNESDNEYPFTLTRPIEPNTAQVSISLELTKTDGKIFTAKTELYRLADPKHPQSVTRIDSLFGGLQVRNEGLNWKTIFPYSFYLSGAWLASSPDNLKKFSDFGYNILHIIPGGEGIGYDLHQLDLWFDAAEKLGLWIMYDMRWTYQNENYVRTQVERYKSRKNMLLWYTADEPGRALSTPPSLVISK
ncbi:MAG: hypothetical protein Q9201_004771 [Fulgogasparrea decipioides]